MRSGTLLVVIAANAAIAVGVVFLALKAFPPTPAEVTTTTTTESRTDAAAEKRIASLEREVETLRGLVEQYRDGTASRSEVAELRKIVEERPVAGGGTAAAAPAAGGESAEEKQAREATQAMMRGMAAGARQRSRQMLESLANPTPESIRQAEDRVKRDADRLGRRLGLPPERTAQVEQALLEVDRRTRGNMRDAINAKGVDNVTYEDAKPLIDQSFTEREQAMTAILTTDEMDGFKAQEQQTKMMLDMGLRFILPPKPTEEADK